jgi:hypothetical protein
VAFTSFGDFHSIPRTGFPDLMWSMGRGMLDANTPDDVRSALREVPRGNLNEFMRQLGAIMMALRRGGKTADEVSQAAAVDIGAATDLLTLLEGLEYVRQASSRYHATIPVLAPPDRPMVADLMRLSREVMSSWLEDNYEPYKRDLMQVTPIGHALPFEASFWNTWHWLFGITNRMLVDAGVFEDPYGAHRRFKGFVPAVWSHSTLG